MEFVEHSFDNAVEENRSNHNVKLGGRHINEVKINKY